MWRTNSDGAGFMYAEDDKLHVVKGLMTYNAFMEAYEPHAGKKMVLHFRIKTHGAKDEVNTHPFKISDDLAFVHNGTITGFGSATHSDTWHFNEELIKPLYGSVKNFLQIAQINELLGERIGWSKLAFMDNKGNTTIINEAKGNYSNDGIWFSNEGWKEYTPPKYTGGRNYTRQSTTPTTTNTEAGPSTLCANDQKVLPFKSETTTTSILHQNSSGEVLTSGDYCWVTQDYRGHKYGTLGVVNWFTSGYLVNVTLATDPSASVYIPIHCISKANIVTLTKNLNHLRKGDMVLLERKQGFICHIYDPETDKLYTVHEEFLDLNTMESNEFNYLNVPWLEDFYDSAIEAIVLN